MISLQRGDQSVTGAGVIAKNQCSALLPPKFSFQIFNIHNHILPTAVDHRLQGVAHHTKIFRQVFSASISSAATAM